MGHSSIELSDPQGPPHVHHMDSKTAYESAKFGMWLFLATEILLFGGLFCAFALFRWMHLDEFHAASKHLNVWMGGTNTIVLLISSYFAAMAVDAAQHGDNAKVRRNILITIGCACIFLVIKYFEYSEKIHHGYLPWMFDKYSPEVANLNKEYSVFFALYFCMTGLHGLHVLIGMALLGWVYSLAKKDRFSGRYYTPVEVGALYWHLVDLIWIYLFPLLYLVG